MLVKSLKLHPYGGKYHSKNSEYEMTKKSDIKLMVAIGCVEPVAVAPAPAEQKIAPVNTVPHFGSSIDVRQETRGRKRKEDRTYDRKDMQAKTNY